MQNVFNAIGRFFTDLLSYIANFAKFITASFVQIFVDLWEFFTDIPVFLFDQILKLVTFILTAIPIPSFPNNFTLLPDEMLNIIGLIGLSQCIGLIVSALIIRFSLQLIPFVRLGS